jgi:hypothetical protein
MKKKIIIATAVLAAISISSLFFIRHKQREATPAQKQFYGRASGEKVVDALENEKTIDREDGKDRFAAPAASADKNLKTETKKGFLDIDERSRGGDVQLGRVFSPGATIGGERKLEYNLSLGYQIESVKAARAFFTQWIPRHGFLLHETASGVNNGYLSLQVRVRSANLYAALIDLDQVGNLTSENITVTDHTENSVHQQLLAAREEIRNRRRSIANSQTGTANKNWEATENLLSMSEDKQLATRMEEWRINDRVGWATIQITLSLPYVAAPAPVEVPEFRNAFVGLLNIMLQLVYAAIYLIPLIIIGYLGYRGVLRLVPTLRKLIPRAAAG